MAPARSKDPPRAVLRIAWFRQAEALAGATGLLEARVNVLCERARLKRQALIDRRSRHHAQAG